jgi:predicted RNase H-like HicB family nuclease/DNA-binding CsgD family transcriptional regulator
MAFNMTRKRIFNVRYSPDDNGTWLVEVRSNPEGAPIGVYTHGRTLAKAEANAREALAAWFDVADEDSFQLLPFIDVDPKLIAKAQAAREKRTVARDAESEAARLTAEVVAELAKRGLSTRDIGYILNVSHQRVQQLLAAS